MLFLFLFLSKSLFVQKNTKRNVIKLINYSFIEMKNAITNI